MGRAGFEPASNGLCGRRGPAAGAHCPFKIASKRFWRVQYGGERERRFKNQRCVHFYFSRKAETASELKLYFQRMRSRTSILRLDTRCSKSSAKSWTRCSACCCQRSVLTISAIST
jgi:hypothetical protein